MEPNETIKISTVGLKVITYNGVQKTVTLYYENTYVPITVNCDYETFKYYSSIIDSNMWSFGGNSKVYMTGTVGSGTSTGTNPNDFTRKDN